MIKVTIEELVTLIGRQQITIEQITGENIKLQTRLSEMLEGKVPNN